MTREELIKVMARAIEPNMPVQVKYWQEGKIQHATMVFPGDPEYVSPVPAALAALAALEAAGVRLVPVEATQEMTGAVLEPTASRYEVMKTYSDMIAASPYAPPGG